MKGPLRKLKRLGVAARHGMASGVALYRRFQTMPVDDLAIHLDPRWPRNVAALSAWENRHAGRRCFILGNGPSLGGMNLAPLRDELTFGLNRIYLLFKRMGYATSFHVVVNRLVIQQCVAELDRLDMPQFVNWRTRNIVEPRPNRMYIHAPYDRTLGFSPDIRRQCWFGATVTYAALQIAFFMGFEEVILIGVDHDFVTRGEPNTVVESTGADPNHFDGDYFGKGFRWQLPDLERSELAYRLARWHYEAAGRRVWDATVGGKLTVFEKRGFDRIVSGSDGRPGVVADD